MPGELHKGGVPTHAEGSFSFDEPTMRSMITKWEELADSYDESRTNARQMVRVEPPGLDFASRSQANAASASGRAYLAYLEHNRDYCRHQAHLLQRTLDDYLEVEHANMNEINKAGPDGSQAGV
jgi:hypothetical protein